ncbi:hypothetical protein FRX31_016157, partial [Thalictrum thalictroides]
MEPGAARDRLMQLWHIHIPLKEPKATWCKWDRAGPRVINLNTDGILQDTYGGWATVLRDHGGWAT